MDSDLHLWISLCFRHASEVYQGSTVGHKAICRFPTVRTAQVEVRFDEEDAELDDLSCYYVQ